MHLFTVSEQLNMVKYYPDTAMILSCYPTISHEVLQSFAAKCHSTLKQLVLLGRQRWVILPSEPWGITSSAQLEGPGGKKKRRKERTPKPKPANRPYRLYIYIDRAPKIVFFLEDVCLPICKCPTLQSSIHHTTYFQAAVLNIISRKLPWRGYAAFRTNPEHSPAHEFLW